MKNPFKGVNDGINDTVNDGVNDIEKTLQESETLLDKDNEGVQEEVKADEEKLAAENSEAEAEEKTEEAASDVNPFEEKYNQLNNQYIRLAADFDNYRKRQEQEREALLKYGAENTIKKFIEVLDNFDRGLKAIETVEDCDKVKECYNLAYKNFTDVMKKVGVEPIDAEGQIFDPNFHEAVMQTPTADKPEHTIIAELQKGYKLGGKVLRPSLVNVATSAE